MGLGGDEYIQWNVRGIADKVRRKAKIQKIESILEQASKVKILNLQETHLSLQEDEPPSFKKLKHIYHIVHSFAPINDRGAGICIFVNKTENIVIQEELLEGRLVYLSLKSEASEESKNIFSFYGKSRNNITEWTSHINLIRSKIMQNKLDNVIILGDFNFVTMRIDRNSHALNVIDNAALQVWSDLEEECVLLDSFRVTSPKRIIYTYSHTDKKSKSRLDRIYVTADLATKVEATNFDVSCFSDHKIVRVRIANEIERGNGSWIFNNSLINDQEFLNRLKNEVREAREFKNTFEFKRDFWDYQKMNIQSVTRMHSTKKAEIRRNEIFQIKSEIEQLEKLHPVYITDESKLKLSQLQEKMAKFEKNKIEGMKLRSKIASYEIGEPKISYLAKLEKKSGERNCIYSLKDEQNVLKEGTENLLKITYNFYKKLYTKEPECERAQDYFLRKIRKRISPEDFEASEKNIEARELYKSLTELQPNKSPGPDGITRELYIVLWPELEEDFVDCVREILEKDELSEMQKRGAIRITHKKGNRDELKNYRPITLLNVDLKILTRTLAKRLKIILPTLIHKSQKAVPGRHITDNIHIVQDLIDVIKMKKKRRSCFLTKRRHLIVCHINLL